MLTKDDTKSKIAFQADGNLVENHSQKVGRCLQFSVGSDVHSGVKIAIQ